MTEMPIGERVAYWRRRRGTSQRVLAGLAGISQPYLSKIENGGKPVELRATLVALADALRVSVAELTGQPGDPTPPRPARPRVCPPSDMR
jgi:transcriptional regulator with XRE-family HTH domain